MEAKETKVPEAGMRRMPLWRKIGYGIGDFGSNYCWSFVAGFVLIYFTNTLGISAAVVGTLMMISRILDGITDVFMGSVIDRTKSKMGKARFWYFVSSFPTAISVFFLFNVPGGFSENTQYIYIFIVYTLMGAVFYTMNNIAYSTLTALVTKNPADRVAMGSYRFIFALLGVLVLNSTTMGLVDTFGGGQAGWRGVSILYSIISLVTLLVPVLCVRELPDSELQDADKPGQSAQEKLGFIKSFELLIKNKYFIIILVNYLATYLISGINSGIGVYYATYVLNNPALLGPMSMAGMLPIILTLPIVPRITSKFGIQRTCIAGAFVTIIGSSIVLFSGGNIALLMTGAAIGSLGSAPRTGSLNALIAATDDYSYLKFGHRITGTIYSCSSVGLKLGTGLGTALCGWLLERGGYNGLAEAQTAQAVSTINLMYILPGLFAAIVGLILMSLLNVEKTNAELNAQGG